MFSLLSLNENVAIFNEERINEQHSFLVYVWCAARSVPVANSLKNPIYKSSLFKARKHPFTTVEKVRFVDALDALHAELW